MISESILIEFKALYRGEHSALMQATAGDTVRTRR